MPNRNYGIKITMLTEMTKKITKGAQKKTWIADRIITNLNTYW